VFGSLGPTGRFSQTTPYDPRSPYSANKAASDHLVSAWHHTYGLLAVLTNWSNNYGPWMFPEKLIPVVIMKPVAGEPIPLYGYGANDRDWPHVGDHVEALLLAATLGLLGESYCVGGAGDHGSPSERTNHNVVETNLRPDGSAAAAGCCPCPPDHPGERPPGQRPALRYRCVQDHREAWLEATARL